MIPVTKTFLPDMDVYASILKRAWDAQWVTNRGVLVKELEQHLSQVLEVPYLTATCNGTIPLQVAIKAMGINGEVITTPFSYVATTSTISWENAEPVFVDIDPEHLTLDETLIEAAITERTTAILATHVFGNPCNTEIIEALAKKHRLHVIYDGAHAFGVRYRGESIFAAGDVSTCSFHATKLFHTAEGGAMMTRDPELHQKLYAHHNFGHKGHEAFQGIGINGKMSELSAALGLAVLPHVNALIAARKTRVLQYQSLLQNTALRFMKVREGTDWNYSYFPVIFPDEPALLKSLNALREASIFPRRYFYPSLSSLSYVRPSHTPVGDRVASGILCLPLYHDLEPENIALISDIVKQCLS